MRIPPRFLRRSVVRLRGGPPKGLGAVSDGSQGIGESVDGGGRAVVSSAVHAARTRIHPPLHRHRNFVAGADSRRPPLAVHSLAGVGRFFVAGTVDQTVARRARNSRELPDRDHRRRRHRPRGRRRGDEGASTPPASPTRPSPFDLGGAPLPARRRGAARADLDAHPRARRGAARRGRHPRRPARA